MTEDIKSQVLDGGSRFSDLGQVKSFNTLACAWSGIVYSNPFAEKAAILALANQAGEIALWMYLPSDGFRFLTHLPVHDNFCLMLKWTRWRVHDGKHEAYIVSSGATGALCLTKVVIDVGCNERKTVISSVDVSVIDTWFEDRRSVNNKLIVYDDWSQGTMIRIAVAKFGKVVVGQVDVTDNTRTVWSTYMIDKSTKSQMALEWADSGKKLRILTMEGQGLILDINDPTCLSLDVEETKALNTKLVVRITQQWEEVQTGMDKESRRVGNDVYAVVYGSAASINGLFTVYLYGFFDIVEVMFYEGDMNMTWMAALLHKNRNDKDLSAQLIANLEQKVRDPPFFSKHPYSGLLRELLEYLLEDDDGDDILEWINCMQAVMNTDVPDITGNFEERVYCDPRATAARMLVLTSLELTRCMLPPKVQEQLIILDQTAQMFIKMLFSYACLAYVMDLPDDALERLQGTDLDTVLLLCDRILVQEVVLPFTIDMIQKALSRLIPWAPTYGELLNEEINRAKTRLDKDEPMPALPREHCPACNELCRNVDDKMAVCPTGHVWETCNMTCRALATPSVRVCVQCGVKSLLPSGESFIDGVLRQCNRCIMCGSVMS
ncbi:hypothetical protein BX666DRAFT_1147589 [Dichotomocladium elegans]|nr:hypothetical protein BX666DRAFT_1147589 [Dichotomocladium elegans]